MVYQFLIRIAGRVISNWLGDTEENFGVDKGAGRLDPVGDLKLAYGLAQPHINGMRRHTELARDVLAGHVLENEAQAVALRIGQQRHTRVARAIRVCRVATIEHSDGKAAKSSVATPAPPEFL